MNAIENQLESIEEYDLDQANNLRKLQELTKELIHLCYLSHSDSNRVKMLYEYVFNECLGKIQSLTEKLKIENF